MLTVLDYLSIYDERLFVTDESSGNVYKITLRQGTLPQEADVSVFAAEPATHRVVVDPVNHLAYVSRSEANAVDIFDPATMHPVKRIPVAEDADGIFYEPLTKLVYVVSGDPNLATLIDPITRSAVGTIALGGKPEFAVFDSQTHLMYQNLKDIDTVAAVDLANKQVVERWPLENCHGPSGMALDETGRRLFVVCSANAMLVIWDLDKKRVIQSIPIGGNPDSVAFDVGLRRIYTTGKSGVLVVVQQETPEAYQVIDSVSLHYGAHTLAVDPTTHWLYVGYASLIARSRVAVFAPRPRLPEQR
jgi:DNA-binding beta-propeller fold protein YncE